jgi:acetyl-CoA C-acetyltransferase
VPASDVVILGWARSPVAPIGGAFRLLCPHELGAPVVRALLGRTGVPAEAVDAAVIGNALGAGGNPARLISLAAGLPDRTAALSVDSQCCAGLDAIIVAMGLLRSGAAELVLAGGVEAWSRAPLRSHRPVASADPPIPYERPAFTPDAERDPDPLVAASQLAESRGLDRAAQDAVAVESHARAIAERRRMRAEIVPVAGLDHDPYARAMSAALLARVPGITGVPAISRIAVAPKADGAAFVLLAIADAARRVKVDARFAILAGASVGSASDNPLLAAIPACHTALQRGGVRIADLWGVEFHEAFAVQVLCLIEDLQVAPGRVNRAGGGLGRGHPIGASGAISLVRLLSDLHDLAGKEDRGLATVSAVGGLGSAVLVERL